VPDVLREARGRVVLDAARTVAERPARHRVAAWRATETEVDPPGVRRLEQAELLRHHQRGVVGQHHAAGPDPDP
jgi:hypothetical protein